MAPSKKAQKTSEPKNDKKHKELKAPKQRKEKKTCRYDQEEEREIDMRLSDLDKRLRELGRRVGTLQFPIDTSPQPRGVSKIEDGIADKIRAAITRNQNPWRLEVDSLPVHVANLISNTPVFKLVPPTDVAEWWMYPVFAWVRVDYYGRFDVRIPSKFEDMLAAQEEEDVKLAEKLFARKAVEEKKKEERAEFAFGGFGKTVKQDAEVTMPMESPPRSVNSAPVPF
jgi:hypothetical protein